MSLVWLGKWGGGDRGDLPPHPAHPPSQSKLTNWLPQGIYIYIYIYIYICICIYIYIYRSKFPRVGFLYGVLPYVKRRVLSESLVHSFGPGMIYIYLYGE